MSYDLSKHGIKVNDFDRLNFWEGRDVDVSISSKKIKFMLLEIIRNNLLFIFQI
jgi:hypothetical protein